MEGIGQKLPNTHTMQGRYRPQIRRKWGYWLVLVRYSGWQSHPRSETLLGMTADSFIAARVSSETKTRLRSLAQVQQQSESAIIKSLLDSLMDDAGGSRALTITEPAVPRGARLYIRLMPEDRRLLQERVAARHLAPATYVAMLVRAHLRELSPLPRDELAALKDVVAQLSAFGRYLNALVRAVNQGANPPDSMNVQFYAMLRICEGLRDHVKAVVKANAMSWQTGHGETNA
jgi:hypothetical protein